MTTAATFPRVQHWTVDGFRVTVSVYKSYRYKQCVACGQRGAIHSVWGERKADGYSGGPVHFCDVHRPAKGTLPDIGYTRHTWTPCDGGGWNVGERLKPSAEWECLCGRPGRWWVRLVCEGCDDPDYQITRTSYIITLHDERTETKTRHEQHDLLDFYECDACRIPPAGRTA